jgi:antitoxin HigA-1
METAVASRKKVRQAAPAHPGRFVKAKIIEAYGLSVTEAAKVLGITRAALSAFINEHSALSSEMALRIEKAFGKSMDALMRMQNSYDIAQARKRQGEIKVAPYKGKPRDPHRSVLQETSEPMLGDS